VSRLCSTIEGTSPAQLAECLGLNPASFQKSELAQDEEDGFQVGVKGEERFKVLSIWGCKPTAGITLVQEHAL